MHGTRIAVRNFRFDDPILLMTDYLIREWFLRETVESHTLDGRPAFTTPNKPISGSLPGYSGSV